MEATLTESYCRRQPSKESRPPLSRTHIASYTILKLLGGGGAGEVYLAEDMTLGRRVALRVLPAGFGQDPNHRIEFIKEAKAASSLTHPNIAAIYELGEDSDEHLFIASEYVEGRDLVTLRHEKTLDMPGLIDLALQIAGALEAAHARNIIHRDLRPTNIRIHREGPAKVLDFGLGKWLEIASREFDEQDAGDEIKRFNLNYLSPEQVLRQTVDPRTDLFSLGVILYELTAGRLPFPGANVREIHDRILHATPNSVKRYHFQATTEWDLILSQCLKKDPDHRIQTAEALKEALLNLKQAQTKTLHRRRRNVALTMLLIDVDDPAELRKRFSSSTDSPESFQEGSLRHELDQAISQPIQSDDLATAKIVAPVVRAADAVRFALNLCRWIDHERAGSQGRPRLRMAVHTAPVTVQDTYDGFRPKVIAGPEVATGDKLVQIAEWGQVLLSGPAFSDARKTYWDDVGQADPPAWFDRGWIDLGGSSGTTSVGEVCEGAVESRAPQDCAAPARNPRQESNLSPRAWRPSWGQFIPGTEWRLSDYLGQGGLGEVWSVSQTHSHYDRAVEFVFDARKIERLRAGAHRLELMEKGLHHGANLIRIHETQLQGRVNYIVFDRAGGEAITTWFERRRGADEVPFECRIEIVAQIAEALQTVHDGGTALGPLSPADILIETDVGKKSSRKNETAPMRNSRNGDPEVPGNWENIRIRLTLFGLGQIETIVPEKPISRGRSDGGSPNRADEVAPEDEPHAAPEIAKGEPPTARADIYSLGVVAYQILSGNMARAVPPGWKNDISNSFLRQDLATCLAPDPAERFESARQFAENLRHLAERDAEGCRKRARQAKYNAELFDPTERPATGRAGLAVTIMALLLVGLILGIGGLLALMAWKELSGP